jgi:hypothetical protein
MAHVLLATALAAPELLELAVRREERDAIIEARVRDLPDGVVFCVELHYHEVAPGAALAREIVETRDGGFAVRMPLPGEPFPGEYRVRVAPHTDQTCVLPPHVRRELHRYAAEALLRVGSEEDLERALADARARLQRTIESAAELARHADDGADHWNRRLFEYRMELESPVEYRLARLDDIARGAAETLVGALQAVRARGTPEARELLESRIQYYRTLLGSLARDAPADALDALVRAVEELDRDALAGAALRLLHAAPGAAHEIEAAARAGIESMESEDAAERFREAVERLRQKIADSREADDGGTEP